MGEDAPMTIAGFDHVAIPAERVEEMIVFYKRLGFTILDEERWRAGSTPVFAIQFGQHKINVHPPALRARPEFTLRGRSATPGCGDFCFVWEGSLDDLTARLRDAGAAIEAGPVPRQGGRGGGTATGASVYTRDPDGNLLEFIVYA
jgi:catechol 2,3-dioxygenase-like lactoylglutathione lyase family enzyme